MHGRLPTLYGFLPVHLVPQAEELGFLALSVLRLPPPEFPPSRIRLCASMIRSSSSWSITSKTSPLHDSTVVLPLHGFIHPSQPLIIVVVIIRMIDSDKMVVEKRIWFLPPLTITIFGFLLGIRVWIMMVFVDFWVLINL